MKKIKQKKKFGHRHQAVSSPKEFRDEVCDMEGCTLAVVEKIECITCEKIGKRPIHTKYTCPVHHTHVREQMKAHAVTKHPSNLLRAFGAVVTGKDMT